MSELIPLQIISDGEFKSTFVPAELMPQLIRELRENEETHMRLGDGTLHMVQGFVMMGKGTKGYGLILLPDVKEEAE